MAKAKRYDVIAFVGGDETRVGRARRHADGEIEVVLHAVPVGYNGAIVLHMRPVGDK